jgi:PHP family Zn ribbon phosphoesterase
LDEFGNEISVLVDANIDAIARVTTPAICEAIEAFRNGNVRIIPGGGGKYGSIELPNEDQVLTVSLGPKDHQKSIFEF